MADFESIQSLLAMVTEPETKKEVKELNAEIVIRFPLRYDIFPKDMNEFALSVLRSGHRVKHDIDGSAFYNERDVLRFSRDLIAAWEGRKKKEE